MRAKARVQAAHRPLPRPLPIQVSSLSPPPWCLLPSDMMQPLCPRSSGSQQQLPTAAPVAPHLPLGNSPSELPLAPSDRTEPLR